jgi:hypothetical protein
MPTTFTIDSLVPEVLIRVENRTTDTSRAEVWLRDTILELASDPDYRDDFLELEEWGPQFILTGGNSPSTAVQEYLETDFVPTGDVNNATLDILIWLDVPPSTNRRKLDVSHYQKTDKFQQVYSIPTEWYHFGPYIGFNPVPNLNYQVQARICRQHPFNDSNLGSTLILLPRDWNEVIIWAAVQRGFMELMEFEKASAVHTLLYGDPKNVAGEPGLIYHMKRKRRKEQYRQEQRLSLIRRPYMWGSS